MELKDFKQIHLLDKIIGWGKKLICWQLLAVLTAGIIIFVGIWFYPDCVIYYVDLAICWFAKDPEITRNVIYFFTAIIGACLLFWRTKIALREVNASEQRIKFTEQSIKTTEKNIIDQRINLATDQIISEDPFIRSRSISNLEKIALSHPKEREEIMKILCSGIRELADREDIKELHKEEWHKSSGVEIAFKALANIAKPFGKKKKKFIELSGVNLPRLRLTKIDLSYFPLADTDLSGANFSKIDFTGTDFYMSIIDNVTFKECKGLGEEQIMEAYWDEGKCPQGLPEKWNLPSTCNS